LGVGRSDPRDVGRQSGLRRVGSEAGGEHRCRAGPPGVSGHPHTLPGQRRRDPWRYPDRLERHRGGGRLRSQGGSRPRSAGRGGSYGRTERRFGGSGSGSPARAAAGQPDQGERRDGCGPPSAAARPMIDATHVTPWPLPPPTPRPAGTYFRTPVSDREDGPLGPPPAVLLDGAIAPTIHAASGRSLYPSLG
jgi:hypothetical protein